MQKLDAVMYWQYKINLHYKKVTKKLMSVLFSIFPFFLGNE